jgi:hypothetical protein
MYKNNNPIQDESQDVLGRSKSAKDLAKYIRTKFEEFEKYKKDHKDQSLTSHNIAVIGEWGEGKTSFINLLKRQLEEPEAKNWFHKYLNKTRKFFKTAKGIEIKDFDPWYFPDKCDIHEQFFSLVDNRKNYLKRWFWTYIILVVLISSGIIDYYFEQWLDNERVQLIRNFINRAIEVVKATYLVPITFLGLVSIIYPHNIKSQLSKIKFIFSLSYACDFNLFEGDKFDPVNTRNQLKKLTDGRKLLIIIDNIDRLYPLQIKRIFDIVKGIGDLPNIIYILAFDKQIVSKALNEKYLDKFIQHSVFLHTNYEELFIRAIAEAFPHQKDPHQTRLLSRYITNIRELKILINTLEQSYESLKDDVIFSQLLFITAIGIQNHAVYYLIFKSKEILCSQNEKSLDEFKKLREEIHLLKPSQVLQDIIKSLFPSIGVESKEGLWLLNQKKNKYIDNYDYFDIYFKISFPDDLVSDSDFKSLVAVASDKDELTKSLLTLLRPTIKEERQKIPNRMFNPFKWLDNLTIRLLNLNSRILRFHESDNIPNWLLSLAKITEAYADDLEDASNRWHDVLCFHSFIDKVAQLLEAKDPAKDHDNPPIYAFLRIYLKETSPQRTGNYIIEDRIVVLRNLVINNIEKYSHNNDISQLSYFTTIIRFASFNHKESAVIVNIIKESIKLDDAFLKLMQYSIQTENGKYVATQYLEYYISFKEAVQKLEGIRQLESSKSYDIDTYINALEESIINKEKTQGTASL